MEEKVVFHIDVNNAFLSWTAVYLLKNGYQKDIRTIPSIIGGDEKQRRGIVLAKSPVAKKIGIKTAETIHSAKEKCKELEIYAPNYKWYKEQSDELMRYLSQYSPNQEQLSIDECFLDMSGMKYIYNDLIELAYKIKNEIKTKFGYTVNIGIGNNKLCAKMASDFEKPDKVHTLFKNEIVSKLWPLDVGDLFMCGKKTKEELNEMKIFTIGDLARTDIKILEKHFKSQGQYLKNAAMGIDETKVEESKSRNASISISETLPYDIDIPEKLKEIIFREVESVTRQLRNKKLYAQTVAVTFKTNRFETYSSQTTLKKSTQNTKEILEAVYKVFDDNYKGEPLRLIGVRLSKLSNKEVEQMTIFDVEENTKDDKEDSVEKTVDLINNKFGKNVIKPASLKIIGESKSKNDITD